MHDLFLKCKESKFIGPNFSLNLVIRNEDICRSLMDPDLMHIAL